MAQIVIFAPAGEDTSAGEQALKDAGHDVEVVEATAENLLHMAIGMVENGSEEPAVEDPLEEPAPDEEESVDEPEEEDPKKMEAMGTCAIDGDKIAAKKGKKTRLYVKEMHRGEKTTFTISESTVSIWEDEHRFFMTTPNGEAAGVRAPVYKSKFGQTYIEVGPELYHLF